MTDLVVTVPMDIWDDWIAEGDAVGSPETGVEWGFYVGPSWRPRPPIDTGDRLYIVAHDHLRGYAPVTRVVSGFRGYRERWWRRSAEEPFPDWRRCGVMSAPERRKFLAQGRKLRGQCR